MKWILPFMLCCLTGCKFMPSANSSESRLAAAEALRYAQTYAHFRHLPASSLKASADGGFYGKLPPMNFEYSPRGGELLLRTIVVTNATGLDNERNRDLRAELERVEREEPKSVDGATFDLVKLPWEEYPKPSLYLKKSFRTPGLSDDQFVGVCTQLSKTAYQWHELYFQQLAERVIRSRK